MRRLFGAAILIGLAALLLLWGFWFRGSVDQPVRLTVAEGASLSSVAEQLDRDGLIAGNATTFKAFARLLGSSDPIQAGEFAIPAGASASSILEILQHGRPVVRLLTIPEGMPAVLVHEKLAAVSELTGEAPVPEEGSVLPDSYDWQAGETRAAVLERMTAAMDKALAEEWAKRAAHSVVDSPREAVILASIVEKETGKASERPMVAGVLSNRLRIGMALGADATTIYPITKGKPLGRMIRKSELAADNGYNTRRKAGLPVGPITNPGRESLAAVLNPAKTDALYYVADGSGGHVFARTLQEHNANVAKWRKYRREKGI
ncbi:endolytic transglycosylase MltG [Sphingomonas xanthus]|uniref:Endolytic murein transglycosylase n=1 Tax=Sphingomonas xanthus TaxID=2594473 RepID=A0A516IPN3_9SPHN|nr:endolytic transglycosylase MltG [Sphingomonas xanthus]QDP18861.1 endolytic transglycosylase MltG [Sphingomonas xanthus]